MTTKQIKKLRLKIVTSWNREQVWLVKHRVRSETICHWFKREDTAKQFASILMSATIECLAHRSGHRPEYGFTDD